MTVQKIEQIAAKLFYVGIGLLVLASTLPFWKIPALRPIRQSIAVLWAVCWVCHWLIVFWAGCWSRRSFTEHLFVRTGVFGMVGAGLGLVLLLVGMFTSGLLVRMSMVVLSVGVVSFVLSGYSFEMHKQRVRGTTKSGELG